MHFSFIQKFLHVSFFGGPGNRLLVCLHDYAIPHNSRTIAVFYRTICLPKPTQFSFFFPHPVRRPGTCMESKIRKFFILRMRTCLFLCCGHPDYYHYTYACTYMYKYVIVKKTGLMAYVAYKKSSPKNA